MMQFFVLFIIILFAQTPTPSSLRVSVADADGQPVQGVTVALYLYEYASDGKTVEESLAGKCATDAKGECSIAIGDAEGILRGWIDLGDYGGRDIMWTGGQLNVPIKINAGRVQLGTEAQPFDFQEKDGGVVVRGGSSWILILITTLVVGGIVAGLYLQSKREHL